PLTGWHLLRRHPGRAALALLGLALAAVAAGWGWRQVEARRAWQAAQECLQRQDFARAGRHLAVCAAAWENDPEVRLWATRAARLSDDYEEAERHLAACEALTGTP